MNFTTDSYSPNVVVKNLPSTITKNNISALFNKYGKLNKIILNNNFALLTFNNLKDAANAVNYLNNTSIDDFNDTHIIVEMYGKHNIISKKNNDNQNKKNSNKIFFSFFNFNILLFCINIVLLFINMNGLLFNNNKN